MGVDVLVESKIEGINSVVEELMRLLTVNCCPHEHEFAVQTALREALANAIVHGTGDGRGAGGFPGGRYRHYAVSKAKQPQLLSQSLFAKNPPPDGLAALKMQPG